MRPIALCLMLACGAELEPPREPIIVAGGASRPFLSVNGEPMPDAGLPNDWFPTGVAFDARAVGWRISCLNGVTPRLEPGDHGAMRLFCGWPAGGAP